MCCLSICLCLAALLVVISSIQTIPLLVETSSLAVSVPRSLASPTLHPILVDCVVWLLPLLVCMVPLVTLLLRSLGNIAVFEAVLSKNITTGAPNSTATPPLLSKEQLQAGFSGIINGWKSQGYARTIALLVLLGVLALVEARARSRLSKIASVLRQSEDAVLTSEPGQHRAFEYEYKQGALARTYSGRSTGAHSVGSHRSYSSLSSASAGKRHLLLPEKVQLDLPSPSFLRDSDLDHGVYPELSYHAAHTAAPVPEYAELDRTFARPSGPRRMPSYYGSEHSYVLVPVPPARTMSKQSLMLPAMVRSRTCGSCSCGSAAETEYGEKPYWQATGPYAGPSSMHVAKQRSARLIEAMILGTVILISCILEGLGAVLKKTLLEDRRVGFNIRDADK